MTPAIIFCLEWLLTPIIFGLFVTCSVMGQNWRTFILQRKTRALTDCRQFTRFGNCNTLHLGFIHSWKAPLITLETNLQVTIILFCMCENLAMEILRVHNWINGWFPEPRVGRFFQDFNATICPRNWSHYVWYIVYSNVLLALHIDLHVMEIGDPIFIG